MLLVIAGIETNPGPAIKIDEAGIAENVPICANILRFSLLGVLIFTWCLQFRCYDKEVKRRPDDDGESPIIGGLLDGP